GAVPLAPRHQGNPGPIGAHAQDRQAASQLIATKEIKAMTEVVLVSCVRTAVARGKADGALASVHPVDVSAAVMQAAIDRAGIDPAVVDDVQWGCAMPEASQGLNHARLAWLRAGYPV